MDILFENGTIRTLERNSPDAQALLVRNGRIAAVGGRTAVEDQTGIDVRRVDLAGRTLLPAFLDAHSHFTAVANQFLQVSLEGCTSWADMQDRIRDYIRRERIPAGQWVTAQGYDHNLLSERRHPDRLCLDAAAPDNPVVICHQSGHMGVFNTAALERLGVTAQTPAPAGGVIGRENGTLTGYMEENAFLEFQKRVPMRPLESFLAAYRKAQDLYASYGITTVQEGLLRRELVPLYQALLADGSLKLDVVAYGDPEGAEAARQAFPESVRQYHRRFKLGGYKMFLDGSPQGRTAWLRRPYQGEQEYRGYGTLTDAEVLDMVRRAGTDGMQLLAHCNGDAACAQYLAALDAAAEYRFIRTVSVYGTAVLPLLEALDWDGDKAWRKRLMAAVRTQAAFYPHFLEPSLAPGEELTPTELQILHLLCADKSNAEIAQIMDVKLPTVKTHVSHILDKLDVKRRAEAKTAAKKLRLIPDDL